MVSHQKDDRVNLEKKMCEAFDKLVAMPEYGGGYNSLTPGHPNFVGLAHAPPLTPQITEEQYQVLVKEHIMFKDMSADTYLSTAGIASHWPFGRGCYVSGDKGFVIWVGADPSQTLTRRSERRTICASCACARARCSTRCLTGTTWPLATLSCVKYTKYPALAQADNMQPAHRPVCHRWH